MASIVGKRRGKRTYYYLVESARVGGEPRIVSQQYLGTAEEVLARLSGTASGAPVRTQHKRFGDLAAVWSVLDDLDVAGVIDAVVPRGGWSGRVGGDLTSPWRWRTGSWIRVPSEALLTGGPPLPDRGG
jgi:hypothetical protein